MAEGIACKTGAALSAFPYGRFFPSSRNANGKAAVCSGGKRLPRAVPARSAASSFRETRFFLCALSVRRREGRGKDHRLPRAARDHRGKLRLPRLLLSPFYHLRCFLTVSPEEQEKRLLRREGKEKFALFQKKWIPLEESYFALPETMARFDLILSADRGFSL